jgi:thiosulfate dehydrogenase
MTAAPPKQPAGGAASVTVAAVVAFVCAVAVVGCGPVPAADVGAALFADPALSSSRFNGVSCLTCHDDGRGEGEARLLAGHPLEEAVWRSAWWGGQAPKLKDAVDFCLVFFMREAPFPDDDPRGRALYEHLRTQAGPRPAEPLPPLPLSVVENVTTVGRGDPARGAVVWDQACRSCHGDPGTGAGRLNDLISRVPDDSFAFAAETGFPIELVLVEKVRHGPFFGIGGNMPFFALERLSDEDLASLIAYLVPDGG